MDAFLEDCLREFFPNLIITSLETYQGDEHLAVELNQMYIIRKAKTDDIAAHMGIEVNLLNALQNNLSFSIPKPLFYDTHHAAFGYKKITGELLNVDWYESLHEEKKLLCAKNIAQFLYELHQGLSYEQLQALEIHEMEWPLSIERLKEGLRHYMSTSEFHSFFSKFVSYYEAISAGPYQAVLIHNDMHENNILVDQKRASLNGVIDFTSAATGDAYSEFCYLYLFSPSLMRDVVNAYARCCGHKPDMMRAHIYYVALEFSRLLESVQSPPLRSDGALIKERLLEYMNGPFMLWPL